ncbi:hypothetical protein PCANC_19287 [Puccinia coronata f. sp. avenae]|uniref:Uncharacterized protein n=1 Tax=Puccinia coronata f. sp. avenae TaxID=200324 RepID=A0A2N5UBR4_9BASI|nr:hypothetical protein PCANC_19287 [Puccinia coronata f. sp. avenae]
MLRFQLSDGHYTVPEIDSQNMDGLNLPETPFDSPNRIPGLQFRLGSTGREQKWKWRRQLLFILPSTFNNRQHNQPTVIDLCDSDNYFDGSNFEARLLAHGIRSPSSLHPLSSTSSHLFKQLSI